MIGKASFSKNLTILGLLVFLLLCQRFEQCSGQIYKQTQHGFDINVGPLFKMRYDRNNGKLINMDLLGGLFKFDYDKTDPMQRAKIKVNVLGMNKNLNQNNENGKQSSGSEMNSISNGMNIDTQ